MDSSESHLLSRGNTLLQLRILCTAAHLQSPFMVGHCPLPPAASPMQRDTGGSAVLQVLKREEPGHFHSLYRPCVILSTQGMPSCSPCCCISTTYADPVVRSPNSGERPSSDSVQKAQPNRDLLACHNSDQQL